MPMMRDTRIAFPLVSLACAAGLAVFGCGGDSGSGPSAAQNDVCSVTKTTNSVTVKTSVDGASVTTVYVFDTEGNMASQTTVSDYSAMGDETAHKAVCEANGSV